MGIPAGYRLRGVVVLIRTEADRVVLIAQPAHAALSGQLARSWGNARFGSVEPFDDVCLGALLHDIGWIDWEQAPTLNLATGLPHSFLQLSTRDHVGIWKAASRRATAFGRYPALLTSMHFTGLYERFHDYSRDNADDARDARALVARELAFQQNTIAVLRADPALGTFASAGVLERNRQLVALWDGISLAICHGFSEPRTFRGAPDANSGVDLVLSAIDGAVSVDPWPFSVERLTVRVDGRVLNGTYEDQETMRHAMSDASWVTVETTLLPAT